MLTYEEALVLILEHTQPLGAIERSLKDVLGHALAQPLVARFPVPRFDNSAVDGYGVLLTDTTSASEDTPASLRLIGEIKAGMPGAIALNAGCAMKILTGGVVPPTVDAVVMREYCREHNGCVLIGYAPERGENIRRQGAELFAGEEVLPSGQRVTPPVVGLLAALGYASFKVHEKPTVAIIATGDELVSPGESLAPGMIFDSNSYALAAALKALGIEKSIVMHARDTRQATRDAFAEAILHNDVVISAGGVSVGDHDHVKTVLEQELSVKTIFWRVAVKPGKPVYFGVLPSAKKATLLFGLPGNPVSALVTYHQFVKPALLRLMGIAKPDWQRLPTTLRSALKKKPGRLDFVRGVTNCSSTGTLEVQPTQGQDSHMLSGLAKANSLIHFARDADYLPEGSQTSVDMLQWSE